MEKKSKSLKRIISILLVFVMVCSVSGIGHNTNVYAAKKGSSTKTITVKNAKKGMKVVSGNFVYRITKLSKKNSTVSVVGITSGARKKIKKIVIPSAIKIKSKKGKNKGTYSYRVTVIAANSFKGCKKVTNVTIGNNVETIGKNAFKNCPVVKKVTLGKEVKNIEEAAFENDKKLTEVVVPKDSKLENIGKNAFKGCTKLKNFNFDNADEIKNIDEDAFKDTNVDKTKIEDAEKKAKENRSAEEQEEKKANATKYGDYTYEVIPLMAPFNSYFYIKTNNPDPDSFRFVDEKSVYVDEGKTGSVTPDQTLYMDVNYENAATKRVKGGYIATGSGTDGGELKLQIGQVTGSHNVYNISTGATTVKKDYKYTDTTATLKVETLRNVVDYLINKYSSGTRTYFDNLTEIQKGFKSECLYSGVYVLGEQKKSEKTPYYGLSTSPHVDQTFYIQDPYYRTDSKSMLVSGLYPMRYDSVGFPSVMMSIAKKLNSEAKVEWSSSAHYLINVTYDGVTKSYGGQGSGGGQGIKDDQIIYRYSFDGSADDAYAKCNLEDTAKMIREYGKLTVPEDPTDQPKLTWASVRSTVGTEGSYVKLVLLTSIFGGSADGYTFMYDNGSTSEGSKGWGSVGHFSNAWYDGRYINSHEYYYPGAKFEDTVESQSPSLIFKDVVIKLPDDGKTYYYNYKTMDKVDKYDSATGTWSGFMTYRYDSASKTWKCELINSIKYKDGTSYKAIEDEAFIDECTITMDEALKMKLDSNTDNEPEAYYIYDMKTQPGTYYDSKVE